MKEENTEKQFGLSENTEKRPSGKSLLPGSAIFARKRVFLLFSHNTLARKWNQLAVSLRSSGVELTALSQNADVDWNQILESEIPESEAIYLECTSHCPVFGPLVDLAKQHEFVLAGSMDVKAELSNGLERQAERFQQYIAHASAHALEKSVFYLLQEAAKARGQWNPDTIEVAPPDRPQLCAIGDPRLSKTYEDVEEYFAVRSQELGVSSDQSNSHPDSFSFATQFIEAAKLVPLLYGRRYWIADDMEMIEELLVLLEKKGYCPLPIFCDFSIGNKLNEAEHPVSVLLKDVKDRIVVWLNLAISSVSGDGRPDAFFAEIGKPVLQLIRDYTNTESSWRENDQGNLLGMTYNFSVAQPEMLGTIEPHLLGVNSVERNSLPAGETPLSKSIHERMDRLVRRINRWHRLQTLPHREKKVGIVLHNSPCKGVEATLGTAAGLNAAQSAVDLMHRMKKDGYCITNTPVNGEALLKLIQERKAHSEFRWTNTASIVAQGGVIARIDEAKYRNHFDLLPEKMQQSINEAWDPFPGQGMVHEEEETGKISLLITGIEFGNVTVMIEPKRGCYGPKCDGEVCRILHQPNIPPTHHWLATAWYMQETFDAIVQMGAESSMDYLPGKSIALSEHCYPDLSLGELPRFYPYIMDSVGEGLLAKRRGKGVMVNHLTPPVRVVEGEEGVFGKLLENHRQLIHARRNEHTQRAKTIENALRVEMTERGLLEKNADEKDFDAALELLARRVQTMRSKVMESGKHVLGQIPSEENMRLYIEEAERTNAFESGDFIRRLQSTSDELEHVLSGLNGHFIPVGQAGSIESGRRNILPSGRNFYAMDLKTVPTLAAWEVGAEMGRQLLLKYLEDEKTYPESIGITLWSSDAFMAEGELTSQCLWLLGCRPKWNKRGQVEGVEVIPLHDLHMLDAQNKQVKRPRVDCVVRMSGVVRDLLEPVYLLIDDAVTAVADLDEAETDNYVRKHFQNRFAELQKEMKAMLPSELRRLASARLFTDTVGAYGAGVGLAVDASAWKNKKDLADAYVNWTGGLCGRNTQDVVRKAGKTSVIRAFSRQIKGVDVAYQRAISSKYDALSISCYTGYQGGMAVTKQATTGKRLKLYWGDSQSGPNGEVRDLSDEIDQALSARLMTGRWVEEKLEAGYDGGSELSGMVDTLFAWAATTDLVQKRHFDLVTRRIIENEKVKHALMHSNVYALEEITRRLLEAQSRGMWAADDDQLQAVRQTMLDLEGDLEDRMGPVKGEFQGSNVDIKTAEDVDRWRWKFRTEEGVGTTNEHS